MSKSTYHLFKTTNDYANYVNKLDVKDINFEYDKSFDNKVSYYKNYHTVDGKKVLIQFGFINVNSRMQEQKRTKDGNLPKVKCSYNLGDDEFSRAVIKHNDLLIAAVSNQSWARDCKIIGFVQKQYELTDNKGETTIHTMNPLGWMCLPSKDRATKNKEDKQFYGGQVTVIKNNGVSTKKEMLAMPSFKRLKEIWKGRGHIGGVLTVDNILKKDREIFITMTVSPFRALNIVPLMIGNNKEDDELAEAMMKSAIEGGIVNDGEIESEKNESNDKIDDRDFNV